MPPTRSPQTPAGAALKERAEAVRDRELQTRTKRRTLVSVHGKLKLAIQSPIEARDAYGKPYIAEKGIMLNFDGYVCHQTSDGRSLDEIADLIEAHPAFTGSPSQPKVVAWEGDPLVPWNRQMPIQTIRGAVGAGPRPVQPPHPEWDSLEPDSLRELVNAGAVNVQKATVWEAEHRRRPSVLIDLAEAMGRGIAGPDAAPDDQVMAMVAPPESFGPAGMGG